MLPRAALRGAIDTREGEPRTHASAGCAAAEHVRSVVRKRLRRSGCAVIASNIRRSVVAQSRGTDQRLASRRASVHQLEDALPRHCTPSRLSAANEDAPHSVVRSGARRSLLTRGRPPSCFFCSSTAPRSSHARAPLEGQRSTRRSRHDYRPPRACACLTSRHPSIRISSLLGGILI